MGNGEGVQVEALDNLIGGTAPGARNVISGNTGAGVVLNGPGTFAQGNFIGTDITGISALGNGGAGVSNGYEGTFVGGTFPEAGNLIAFNGGPGVAVGEFSVLNAIRFNSIHSNAGPGIDLLPSGPTPNDVGDSDAGGNNLQNFPVLTAVTSAGFGPTTLQGNLNSTPNTTFFLDFYATNAVEPGGVCGGRSHFGTALVTTDASGNAPVNAVFSAALSPGTQVTATATTANTLPLGDTSEFSPCIAVSSAEATPTPTPSPGSASLQFSSASHLANEDAGYIQVTVTRTGYVNSAATVDYATTDRTANDRGDYTTAVGRLRFAPGENAKSFLVFLTDDHYVESEETLQVALSNPTGASLGSANMTTLTIVDNDFSSVDNPIDETAFFVRQHYIEFLNRAPDPDGFAYWVSNIESCGGDQRCRDLKRTDTSAAFFLSIEFQETGFLVHRLFRAGLNRLPRYREFIRDARELGRGVVVGRFGWEAQLEANQQSLAAELAARSEFTLVYGSMTNAQYVDALNTNSGGSLSPAERDALVAALNSATETRASVLLKVAEDADFIDREKNPAFVLTQYFGYLRRNPDDPPDTNFSGFDFWLAKLNEFGGDFRRAEMVKSFLVSTEYRKRFGP